MQWEKQLHGCKVGGDAQLLETPREEGGSHTSMDSCAVLMYAFTMEIFN